MPAHSGRCTDTSCFFQVVWLRLSGFACCLASSFDCCCVNFVYLSEFVPLDFKIQWYILHLFVCLSTSFSHCFKNVLCLYLSTRIVSSVFQTLYSSYFGYSGVLSLILRCRSAVLFSVACCFALVRLSLYSIEFIGFFMAEIKSHSLRLRLAPSQANPLVRIVERIPPEAMPKVNTSDLIRALLFRFLERYGGGADVDYRGVLAAMEWIEYHRCHDYVVDEVDGNYFTFRKSRLLNVLQDEEHDAGYPIINVFNIDEHRDGVVATHPDVEGALAEIQKEREMRPELMAALRGSIVERSSGHPDDPLEVTHCV